MLRVSVQSFQVLLIFQVDRERVILRFFRISGAVVLSRPAGLLAVLRAVEGEIAHAEDGGGLGVDPEVDKVELASAANRP